MFGYVTANSEILPEEDKLRYKSVYCGLCHALKKRHGHFGRMSLNYDMVFLILVLNSLGEPETRGGEERCIVHPCKKHRFTMTEITDYSADMNVALAYLNQLDNWNDDRNVLSLLYSRVLKKKFKEISGRYPHQCGSMTDCIKRLSELEKSGGQDPDSGAKIFGRLMGELFIFREDRWAGLLRDMASSLGEFIYVMDAAVDLRADIKKRRYNPLACLREAGTDSAYIKDILTMLIGNCTINFEKLPLVEDISIMRNILYSGVWAKFELGQAKRKA
jgi:hypothetical protein